MDENFVKNVCKKLGITQKELSEKMGVNDVTVRTWSSKGNVPEWAVKFMNCLLEKKECETKLQKIQMAFKYIEEARKLLKG
ncbi:helix-turn-helix domain-containing protein [Caminibacter sp.]